jgi:predicted Ser/Thr protein kinase
MDATTSGYGLTITRNADRLGALIRFHTHQDCDVILRVLNEEEREVRMLLNEELGKGSHSVAFSFGTLSGNYHIRLVVNTHNAIDIETHKIKID